MRNELLAWFAREGLLLQQAVTAPRCLITCPPDRLPGQGCPVHDEVKIVVKAPVIALSRAARDARECPDPALFGYPESSLEMMTLDDMHQFVYQWLERAVQAGMGRCFVCNKVLDKDRVSIPMGNDASASSSAQPIGKEAATMNGAATKPWDAVFVTTDIFCWLLVHFDCKRYLSRDLKGRHPFEIVPQPPEFFDLRV